MFVPKKYQNGSALPNDRAANCGKDQDAAIVPTLFGVLDEEANEEYILAKKTRSRTWSTPQSETPKGPGSRLAGTPITETEMMRRRRLLDSHIFE